MTKQLLAILLEWLYSFGEGIMNLANKLLFALNKPGGGGVTPTYDERMIATYSPLFYWIGDEASGSAAASSGSVASAGGTYSASDIAGAATGPDGGEAPLFVAADSDYLDLYSAALEANYTQNNVSFAMVFRMDGNWGTDTSNYWGQISMGAANRMFMHINAANSFRWRFIHGGTSTALSVNMSTLGIADGNYHSAVLTLNTAGNASILYIDGVSRATGVCPTFAGTTLEAAACVLGGISTTPGNNSNVVVSRFMMIGSVVNGTAAADIASIVTG